MNRSEHEKNITPIQIDTTNNHINTELVETFSPESLYQQYQTYTKINDCVQDIQHIFTKKNLSKQEYNKQITNKISDMLTDRESYHQLYDLHQ